MKKHVFLLTLLVIVGFVSCETEENINNTVPYSAYLNDKAIIRIHIQDKTKYIFTSRYCDTCYVSPFMSSIPTIEEWTVIKSDSIYENYPPSKFDGVPKSDNHGKLYIAKANIIYKKNDKGVFEKLLDAGNYVFESFTFDKNDNIWFYGFNNGIAYWNKSEFKIFNTQNSQIPTNKIHGLAVDKTGILWVSLDFKGLLKIENEVWTIIPNSEIPGLNKLSYLRGPKIGIDNSVWFEVFNPISTSNVLKFQDNKWEYEFLDNSKYTHLNIDSKGTIWAITNYFENSGYTHSTLKYKKDNTWVDFDITGINKQILTVNADDTTVYIGTTKGLIEKPR